VVVTDSRVWVAYAYTTDQQSGASEIRLKSVSCESTAIDLETVANTAIAGGRDVQLAASGGRLMVAWNGLSGTAVPPGVRTFDLTTGAAGVEQSLALQGADATSQAVLRVSGLRALTGGGVAFVGTSDALDGTCAQPFVQKLDETGLPVGGFLDFYAGGLGKCARTISPLQQGADGTLFMSWVSSQVADGTLLASLNDLFFAPALLGTTTQLFQQVPASLGVDPSGLVELVSATASGVQMTAGSNAARSSGPWQPQFVVFTNRPAGGTSQFLLRDVLQPETSRLAQTIEVREGGIDRPRLIATEQGGLLAWTITPSSEPAKSYFVSQRFAYNGDSWKVGERIPLQERAPNQRLQAIAPVGNDRYFALWTDSGTGSVTLRGTWLQP
jgi:hypothetical protein